VRQVVAIPPNQCRIARVLEKKSQRRRFNVAVAEYHVGFTLMAGKYVSASNHVPRKWSFTELPASKLNAAIKRISNSHHIAWDSHF